MSNKKRLELRQTEKDLLEFSAVDSIPALKSNKKLSSVTQTAFQYYDPDNKEYFDVQVKVTRNKSDFLEPFQTEETEYYKG